MRPLHPLVEIQSALFDARANQPVRNNGLSTHFWFANEYVSLAEVLPPRVSSASDDIVSILVGESDFLSAIHKIPGHIIFCDIDRALLLFIKSQVEFFQNLYSNYYVNNRIPFAGIVDIYKNWLRSLQDSFGQLLEWHRGRLGKMHFLFSEENYVRSMQVLSAKTIIVVDIDFFSREEQDLFCGFLGQYRLRVNLFNATNLPDYDRDNVLSDLFFNLSWTEDALIAWTIHDGGARNTDFDTNVHYPFLSTPDEFRNFRRPEFLADVDRMNLPDAMCQPDFLRRYAESNECLQDVAHSDYRERYLGRLVVNVGFYLTPANIGVYYQMYGVPRDFNAAYFIRHLEQSLEMMCQQAVKRCQVLNAEMQGYTNRWSERMRRCELLFFQQQLHLRREMIDEAMLQSLRPSSAHYQQFWREVVQILFQICITVEPRVSVIKRNHYFFSLSQRKSLVEAACVESASVTLHN